MTGDYKTLLILPHIQIHNANALSSPFTIGFPAITAWLGAVHALERQLNQQGQAVKFLATGVVSHQMDLQTYRGDNDYVSSIVGMGNPLVPKKKRKKGEPWENFERDSFIEEARCHIEVSLVVEIYSVEHDRKYDLLENVSHFLHTKIKIAGGDIQAFNSPEILIVEEGNDTDLRKLTRKLMPGYAILERRDLMVEAMDQGQDAMEAMLDYLAVHHQCEQDEEGNVVWRSYRKSQTGKLPGWIVPIATGFHGISELGAAKNQRDPDVPHRFAESLVTLGEFKMPYRFKTLNSLLWRYHVDEENNLYQCIQKDHETVELLTNDNRF
jgi:CRISPR-associated protein Csy2